MNVAPRMRTIGALARHYKALDDSTAITAHFLRSKILGGEIPHVRAGQKRLIAIEDVDAYLSGASLTGQERGGIRRAGG